MKRLALASLLTLLSALVHAQLPPGFVDNSFGTGLATPTAIAFAPDGRILACEKAGRIRVITTIGSVLPTPFLTINVSTNSERGLLGIALDPNFESTPYVYVYYTTNALSLNPPATPKNRVSRFTANGNTADPASEIILLDDIPSDAGNHNAGCLRFGPDGRLYISTGDGGATPGNSQDVSNLAGKILRINKDGTIPGSNPFVGQALARWEIYCYGLRNPFRFSFRPGNGAMFIGDVGQAAWEEVNLGAPAANFGWPTYEGPTNVAGYTGPVFAYPTGANRGSITGGVFATKGTFPPSYNGRYYYGDFVRDQIRGLTVTSENAVTGDFDFASASGPVDFAEGPDGWLYYVSIKTGAVRRIRYKPDITAVTLNPDSVTGGTSSTGTVHLSHPAPARGAVVALSSTSGATVPSSVTIPSGATSRSFTVQTATTSTDKNVTITAVRMGVTRTATLQVTAIGFSDSEFVSQSVPTSVEAGSTFVASLTFRNSGTTTWSEAAKYRLASRSPADNRIWGTQRLYLPSGVSVSPGATHAFSRTFRAPSSPGTYAFQWKTIQDGVGSFGDTSPLVMITVNP